MIKLNHKNSPLYQEQNKLSEQFLHYNSSLFEDRQLLELLLSSCHEQTELKSLIEELLLRFGNIRGIIHADSRLIKNIPNINNQTLTAIKLARELTIRSMKQQMQQKLIIENWSTLIKYCQLLLLNLHHEQMHAMFLNKKLQLITDELIGEGTTGNVEIDCSSLIQKALSLCASYLILVHNHPSGEAQPSESDIINTTKIFYALEKVNIQIYDHIIIAAANEQYYSFRNSGLI